MQQKKVKRTSRNQLIPVVKDMSKCRHEHMPINWDYVLKHAGPLSPYPWRGGKSS